MYMEPARLQQLQMIIIIMVHGIIQNPEITLTYQNIKNKN
jgi:hypothetical protein